jgi:4-hydroxybenzoate polyprenyltransferase
MISKSTLSHLRLPVSYFLLPVFLFAVLAAKQINFHNFILVFIVLHFFLYTASNGFNSYYDKDKNSIGSLKHPPKVTRDLLRVSLALDGAAIAAALFVHPLFSLGCFLYGLVSKAYSWDRIRLKRLPVISWLLTGVGVGTIGFLMTVFFLDKPDFSMLLDPYYMIPAGLVGIFILGFYPLTQVYQHQDDRTRGDRTISMVAGIRGTFVLSAVLLLLSLTGLGIYIYFLFNPTIMLYYITLQVPGIVYFIYWLYRVWLDKQQACFDHIFRLSIISTSGLNIFCFAVILSLNKLNF